MCVFGEIDVQLIHSSQGVLFLKSLTGDALLASGLIKIQHAIDFFA